MDKKYVKEVSTKAKDAIYDLIRMRRPYKYLVNEDQTFNLDCSIEEFKNRTVNKCREVTDLIWPIYEENLNNQEAMEYLTPLLITYNLIVELGDNPTGVSDSKIEAYLANVYPEL